MEHDEGELDRSQILDDSKINIAQSIHSMVGRPSEHTHQAPLLTQRVCLLDDVAENVASRAARALFLMANVRVESDVKGIRATCTWSRANLDLMLRAAHDNRSRKSRANVVEHDNNTHECSARCRRALRSDNKTQKT